MPTEEDVVVAFHESSASFVELVGSIDPARYGDPGTGEWTVRELIAHTMRAFIAIEEVLARPLDPTSRRLTDAADYYRTAMSIPGVHDGISERARAGGALIEDDPSGHVRSLADRVGLLVDATPAVREVQHYVGRIAFGDYLVTRVTELVLHSVDLQVAVGYVPSSPRRAAAVVCDGLRALADRVDALAVACALSGRSRALACDVLA